MKTLCPYCGDIIRGTECFYCGTVVISQASMDWLQPLMAKFPVEIRRVLDIMTQMPEEKLEEVLRLLEDILRR